MNSSVTTMEFIQVIKNRRSVRKYKNDPIPDEILNKILESARLAPSGGNSQPWHFIVVKDFNKKGMLDISSWAENAPVIIVGCTEASNTTDIAIAFEHLILAATNFGLGTCWIGRWGADDEIKKVLGIPAHIHVIAVTPLGYPNESPPIKERKPLSQIVHNEKF